MQRSIDIARLLSPILLVAGVAVFLNMDSFRIVAQEALQHMVLIFLSGMLTLTAGVAIVLAHNLWIGDWRLIITLLGWIFIVSGVIRTALPQVAQRMGEGLFAHPSTLTVAGIFVLGIALVLGYFGYFAPPPRQPSRRRK